MRFKLLSLVFLLCLTEILSLSFSNSNHPLLRLPKTKKENKAYKRIVNLGLPKTGTSSLRAKALEVLGKSRTVTHWDNCFLQTSLLEPRKERHCFKRGMCGGNLMTLSTKNLNKLFDHFINTFKVYAQIDCMSSNSFTFPQIQLLEQMFKNEDEVVWVMTTRNTNDWRRSVTKWNDMETRFISHLNSDILKEFGFERRPNSHVNDDDVLTRFKTWHEKRVLDLAKKYNQQVYVLDLSNLNSLETNFTQAFFKLTGEKFKLTHYDWANKN